MRITDQYLNSTCYYELINRKNPSKIWLPGDMFYSGEFQRGELCLVLAVNPDLSRRLTFDTEHFKYVLLTLACIGTEC